MPGKKTMKQAKKLGMKESGYKSGKTVKMNMGMQVPNYQDTVRTRFAEGGKFGSIETRTLKPTAGTGVQSKPVGTPTGMPNKSNKSNTRMFVTTPTQVPNKSEMIAAAKAKANAASLATDRPARTSTPNTAGAAAARASITTNRGNFGGESRGGTGTKVVPKKKPVAKKKKLPSKRGGG
tara:strand:- start:35 stop:571 length:537 start_codon:yes stop_codon:yes gene_type:complete